MTAINYRIFDSVTQIGKEKWLDLFGDAPEGYGFWKTLEESGFEEHPFFYIALFRNSEMVLIAPAMVTDLHVELLTGNGFSCIVRSLRKIIPRFFITKTIFLGSSFDEHGALGIRKDIPPGEKRSLASELSEIVGRLCNERKIPLAVFKDFPGMESDTMAGLEEKGYLRIDSLPSVLMEVNFASIEDYLKTLSRPRRKDMRRKLRRARDGGIEIRPVDNIDEIIDEIYGLYLKTYEAGSIKFEKLTRDFFARITRNISPYARYFLYYAKGKLAAFNLCFIYKDLFIDKS